MAVILIEVPALKDRLEDIPALCTHFIQQIAQKDGVPEKAIKPEALQLLKEYPWSGNIRELRNLVERLMILGDNPISKKNIKQYATK